MYKAIFLILFSIIFVQELEVVGDLKVTGNIQNDSLAVVIANQQQQINSLLLLISDLELRITTMECLNSGIILEGYCNCNGNVFDVCGVCGGNILSEDECFDIYDYDGNGYNTVEIGDQLWMKENLKTTHYNNGDIIPNITNNGDWSSLSTGAYGDYDNNPSNSETYGRVYNWYAVDDNRGVCPENFHVPTDEEFTQLSDFLGGSNVAGGKMKEAGLEHWNSPNIGATNESSFTAFPGGYRTSSGNYYDMGNNGDFWSSSEDDTYDGWYHELNYSNSVVNRFNIDKRYGFSVRCIQD